jgi:hypothetical protein
VDRGANPEAVESAAAAEIEHVQRPVGDLAVGVALSAGGERRCKIRENVGNDGHYSPCRLSCAHNVVGTSQNRHPVHRQLGSPGGRGFHDPP